MRAGQPCSWGVCWLTDAAAGRGQRWHVSVSGGIHTYERELEYMHASKEWAYMNSPDDVPLELVSRPEGLLRP